MQCSTVAKAHKASLGMLPDIFLTVIVPCCNEEQSIEDTVATINREMAALGKHEIIIVDDGSEDETWTKILHLSSIDSRVRGIRLSRNFGHQAAVAAGLAHSKGRLSAVLDADLQDPPSVLADMIKLLEREQADVVYGIRKDRQGVSLLKRVCYASFYKVFAYLTGLGKGLETGDFRVMSRRIVDHLNKLPETDKYVRGLVSWLGFKQIGFEYVRPPRTHGRSKYSFTKLLELALSGITSFSISPLRFAIACACFSAALAVLLAFWAIVDRYLVGSPPQGWASIIVLILTLGAVHFLLLGVIGEYLGRVFLQTKNRPAYIVAETSSDSRLSR